MWGKYRESRASGKSTGQQTYLRFVGGFMEVGRPTAAAATILSYTAPLTALRRAPWTRNASERWECAIDASGPLPVVAVA